MNKKSIVLCIIMMFMLFVFAGCGSTKEAGDIRFTYDWKLYSITDEKGTIVYSDYDIFAPKFSSSNGITCTFTNNGKSHNGTLEKKDDNNYTIRFDDTDVPMDAEITDDTLTLTIKDGAMVLVFKLDD